jgi:hypothetical protein
MASHFKTVLVNVYQVENWRPFIHRSTGWRNQLSERMGQPNMTTLADHLEALARAYEGNPILTDPNAVLWNRNAQADAQLNGQAGDMHTAPDW